MSVTAPLQILLFRHPKDTDVLPYEEAIVRAFQGGKEAGGYLATGEDLAIELKLFATAPALSVSRTLDAFPHTVAVLLVDRNLLDVGGEKLWDWLEECWLHVSGSNGRHAMLAVPMDERIGRQFSRIRPALGALQLLQAHELGEWRIRPAYFALRLLHECRVVLAAALSPTPNSQAGFLKIFISHTKLDGLPLAHALKYQIAVLGWLKAFYDVDDIPPGADFPKILEQGVGSSLIVMLRTDLYDDRPWCQEEVLWADEYATPAVLVDARTGLNYPAGILPFDRVPTVRIPDGNLMRILFLALREGLRFLCFMRRVELMKQNGALPSLLELRVFCFQPSMAALLRACQALAGAKGSVMVPRIILYPDPPLRRGLYEAAVALVNAYVPDARLVTPQTLAATKGGGP